MSTELKNILSNFYLVERLNAIHHSLLIENKNNTSVDEQYKTYFRITSIILLQYIIIY